MKVFSGSLGFFRSSRGFLGFRDVRVVRSFGAIWRKMKLSGKKLKKERRKTVCKDVVSGGGGGGRGAGAIPCSSFLGWLGRFKTR